MGSLLKDRISADRKKRKKIDEKIHEAPIRPTKEEGEIVKEILIKISEDFREDLARYGFAEDIIERIKAAIERYCNELDVDYEVQKRIEQLAIANVIGNGPIEPFMKDESVTEIIVQRYDNICIERNGIVEKVDTAFLNEQDLVTIINRIVQKVGRAINIHTPMVDARLQDGSRVNATIPPATPDGATLTIRKFSNKALKGEDYVRLGSMSEDMLTFLSKCVEAKISMIVSGGTNTGKTTLLNMLSSYIPKNELIITIEDSCELRLNQPNVRRMETRVGSEADNMMPVTIQSLVRNALRMRPDRIVVGEIRDHTIVDMMSAMSTGHEGSMSTVHANSPNNLVNSRMPILYGMNKQMTFTSRAQAMQISEALHLIVQVEHTRDGKRRLTYITHVVGLDKNDNIILKDIFKYDNDKEMFTATGYVPQKILQKLKKQHVEISEDIFNLKSSLKEIKKEG